MSKKTILRIFCGILLLVALYKVVSIVGDQLHSRGEFEALAEEVEKEAAAHPPLPHPETEEISPETPSVSPPDAEPSHEILPRYAGLHGENPDFAGWVQIEDTKLDYPVMYTPDDPEFYLYRGFDKARSASGTPFIGQGCTPDPQSANLILYGHNMKNKTMFATLLSYREEDFWRSHPCIRFDTLYTSGVYEIFSVFPIDITPGNGHFAFYDCINFDTEEERQGFIEACEALSLYDTGVSVRETDHFLTLVTCSYHTENGRFVVVAREKDSSSSLS